MPGLRRWPLTLLLCLFLIVALLGSAGASPTGPASISATFQYSLALDGAGDYVEVPHHAALSPTSALTIEAWVRYSGTTDCDAIISKDYQSSYWLGLCNKKIRFYSGGGTPQNGLTDIPANVWTHIAVVWQGGTGGYPRFYINGDLDYQGGTPGAAPAANTYPLFIGADPGSDLRAYEFSGNIAEVRLWSVARSQNEIRRTMHVLLDERRPGLVAAWHLMESANYRDAFGTHHGASRGNASITGPQAPSRPALVPVDSNFNTLPATRYGAGSVYIPRLNRALLIGGSRAGNPSNQLEAVDAGTGAASTLGSGLPAARFRPAAAYVPTNDTVYVFGGSETLGTSSTRASIYAVNPETGAVRTLEATLPAALRGASAVYHERLNKIYVLGGLVDDVTIIRSISVFDPATESIESPSGLALPANRYNTAAAYSAASDKIYIFGGSALSIGTRTIYELALGADGLSGSITELAAQLPRDSYGMAAFEDPATRLIYLFGGSSERRLLVFDPLAAQLWSSSIELPARRHDASAVYSSHSRHALVLGGYETVGQSNLWRVPLGHGPATPLGRWDFPQGVGSSVMALDGDEKRVVVGTLSSGAYIYNQDGTRTQRTPASLGSASGYVTDVRYNAASDHVLLGTYDAGAKVDNGSSITTYGSSVLSTNTIRSIDMRPGYTAAAIGPQELLIGTESQGLKRYYCNRLTGECSWGTSFANETIRAITHRAVGDAWVIAGEALKQLSYNTFVATPTDHGARCSLLSPTDLAFSPDRSWWIVSPGIEEFGGEGICYIPAASSPGAGTLISPAIGNAANRADVDADGRVWVSLGSSYGESGGLAAFQTIGTPSSTSVRTSEFNWENAPVGSRTPVSPLTLYDSGLWSVGAADERVWAGKRNGELVTLAQRWQQLDESNDLDQKQIEGIWLVRGRAFLGTSNSLHVLAPDGTSWDNRDSGKVWDMLGDSQGRIWTATNTGIRLYTPTGWDHLATAAGTRPAYAIYALAEDQQGRVWIGGLNGLTLFDRERFVMTLTSANSDLPADKITALLVDRDNRLWVGTEAGLARLDGASWTLFTTADDLPSNRIHDLAQLGSGEIAISTNSGLSLYDGTSFNAQTPPIPANNLPLAVDELGRLWAGSAVRTSGGWQGYYWTNSGLGSSTISSVATDGADRVWFGHAPDKGVSIRGTLLPPLADSVPIISSIAPDHGSAGDELTISGSGFGSNPADLTVHVGGATAEVIGSSDTELRVRLNANNTSGAVSISLGGRRSSFTGLGRPAFCAEPVITSFSPTGGNDGVMIEVHGSNFDPGATLTLGGPQRLATTVNPTLLRTYVQSSDGSGALQVSNSCPGGPSYSASSSTPFQRVGLNLAALMVNQGITTYGLVADKPTQVSAFLRRSVALRPGDRLEVDTVEVSFINPSTGLSRQYTRSYSGDVPSSSSNPGAALLADITNSVNVNDLKPDVGGGDVQVRVTLKRRGMIVAETTQTRSLRPNMVLHVLLVPIMLEGYTAGDLWNMRNSTNAGLDQLRRRIWPTGEVEFHWSITAVSESEQFQLQDVLALYSTSHDMERTRSHWNEHFDPDTLIAFGVVDPRLIAPGSDSGYGFWPDASQVLNLLLLNWVDTLCDIGNAVVQVLSLGFLGSDDGCHLTVPLYVGWAEGNAANPSSLFGHEFGHIMGLVKPWSPNGAYTDNVSHSVNDELDNGSCNDAGATYNSNKTLYRQPGVSEPVVNPITGQQLLPQLGGDKNTDRAKALMSYACSRTNANAFFEPPDVLGIYAEFSVSSARGFIEDITPGGKSATSAPGAVTADEMPSPRPISGPRVHVSGTVNRASNTGQIRRVETLGSQAPLSASFASGYWLVQRDAAGTELARLGVLPIFSTSESAVEGGDHGFFAATLLQESAAARIELWHDDRLLQSFSAGSAAPTASISSPSGGSYAGGSIPVTWTAADADGDALETRIDYSADGGSSWQPVAFSSGSGTVNVPVAQLAGSSSARFRVTASDGLHSGSASSAAFSVAAQPPRPYIGNPAPAATLLEGQRLLLSGGADDNQDGALSGSSLRWSSSRDGALGSGEQLEAALSVGSHTLRLTARNSAGMEASTSVSVVVQGDYDADRILDTEELVSGLSPLSSLDALSDADGDGLPLRMERGRGLNPNSADSDGDGRSDATEVAAGSDPANADAAPLPDQLSVAPGSLSFEVDRSLDTPLPQQLLQLLSRQPAGWTVTANVDWLAISAANGTTPSGPTVLVKTHLLGDGQHTGRLTFSSPTLGNSVEVPVTVQVTNSLAHFDTNQDGQVNIIDVQQVAARIGSDNSQASFDHRYDIDRNGSIEQADVQLLAQRWSVELPDPPATSGPVLRISPPGAVPVGQDFTVDVQIENASALGGFELKLHYNPALLELRSVALGEFLGSTGRSTALLGPADASANGELSIGGYSSGGQAGPSGSGRLVRVTFRVRGPGSSILSTSGRLVTPQAVPTLTRGSTTPVGSGGQIYLPTIRR